MRTDLKQDDGPPLDPLQSLVLKTSDNIGIRICVTEKILGVREGPWWSKEI